MLTGVMHNVIDSLQHSQLTIQCNIKPGYKYMYKNQKLFLYP